MRKKGQTLVEFALIFPIVILFIIGVIEMAHLLFFYLSTEMAAEESVRYGVTVGTNDEGVPHYQDCEGIRARAEQIARLGFPAEDPEVSVGYDLGPNSNTTIDCPPPNELPFGARVVVTVHSKFEPWLPLFPRDVETTAKAARTIAKNLPASIGEDGGGSSSGSGANPTNTPTSLPPTNTPTSLPPTNTPTPLPPTNTPTPLPPTNTPTPLPITTSCTLTYDRGAPWFVWLQGKHQREADLTISTTLPQDLHNWFLSWTYAEDQAITDMWNASYAQNGPSVTITPASWEETILANGSLSGIGFHYTYSDADSPPSNVVLTGTLDDGTLWSGTCTVVAP